MSRKTNKAAQALLQERIRGLLNQRLINESIAREYESLVSNRQDFRSLVMLEYMSELHGEEITPDMLD